MVVQFIHLKNSNNIFMQGKLIIYSPFNSLFGDNIWGVITGKKNPGRDKIIFIKDLFSNENVYVYFEEEYNNSSADIVNKIPLVFIRRILIELEFYFWCKYYKINYSRIKIIRKISKILQHDVILSTLHYLPEKNSLKKTKAKQLIYASHFFYNILKNVNKISNLNNVVFLAEANLTKKSNFFRKYFGLQFNTYVLPFQIKDRFIKKNEWNKRSSKCLALGTTHELPYTEHTNTFIDYYKKRTWHYMRDEIYISKNKYPDLMNIKIERFNEDLKVSDNKLIAYFQNIFILGKQNKYFSFDIVEQFNQHKIFISPEERAGLPSINFVEGMACGCAYIGLDSEIYGDLGMINGHHYIGYDGTMEDLIVKLKYYNANDNLLEDIANNGFNFVTQNFDKNLVKKKFLDDIITFYNTGVLNSSFYKEQ